MTSKWLEIALTSISAVRLPAGTTKAGRDCYWLQILTGAANWFIRLANIAMFDGSYGRGTGFARARGGHDVGDILCPAPVFWL